MLHIDLLEQAQVAWDANKNVLCDVYLHKDEELVEGSENVSD